MSLPNAPLDRDPMTDRDQIGDLPPPEPPIDVPDSGPMYAPGAGSPPPTPDPGSDVPPSGMPDPGMPGPGQSAGLPGENQAD